MLGRLDVDRRHLLALGRGPGADSAGTTYALSGAGIRPRRRLDSVVEVAPVADEGYQPFPDLSAWTAVPFDPTTYEQYAALLEQARAEATEEARERALRAAVRSAGTDTGAIEGLYTTDRGFTRTVAVEAAHWEVAANERGPNAAEIIRDQIDAYDWVLDLVTEQAPITEHVIRELHLMLCRSQETYVVYTAVGRQERPLPKGQYKEFPNNPTSLATGQQHHYAPVDMVAPEMQRLVASLSSSDYTEAHPVVQAAYLHYSLVAIHPFADGNGRTTRALASVPLYRHARVPFLVFRDQRDEYFDALGAADTGDLGTFVRFVHERVVDAIELVRNSVKVGLLKGRDASIAAIEAAQRISGFSPDEIEAVAGRIREEAESSLSAHLRDAGWPSSVKGTAFTGRSITRLKPPAGYRWPRRDLAASVNLQSLPPAKASTNMTVGVAIADSEGVPALALTAQREEIPDLQIPARDLTPQVREVAKIKIADWTALVLDVALRDLATVVADVRGTL